MTVVYRCRPLDVSRQEKRGVVEIDRLRKEIRVNERLNSATDKQSRLFTYDGVFDTNVGQCEVYDHVVAPLIDEVLAGYNCTVFAYGQTGTGKTYTMEGERSDYECSWQDDPKAGIVPRALDQLFETLSESSGTSQVAVSYMELYNEKLYDLLNPTDDFASLSIYEDKGGKVKIGRLAQIAVTKKEEIFEILQKGSAKRQKAATKLNSCSSRSHTIFTVTIRSKDPDAMITGEEIYRIGKLNLVDLAGSENIGRSGAVEKRAAEAGNINKSLLTLGRVITSLVERQNHIPYRESKLTRLLQDSLGGGTKTSIIATISPNILDVEDTLSTLDYAQRAKKIQNKPEVNQKIAKVDILRDVEEELIRMRRDLEAARCGTNAFVISKENYDSMTSQIQVLGKEAEEREARIAEIDIRIADLEVERENINALFSLTKQKLEDEIKKRVETEETLEKTEQDLKVTVQDRNEQKHLVGVRAEKEKILFSEASILKNVAQEATGQLEKIHEKVARYTKLHHESISNVDQARETIEEQMEKFQNYVSENVDTNYLGAIDNLLKSKFEQLVKSVSAAEKQADLFTGSVSSGITSLSDSSKKAEVVEELNKVIVSTERLEIFRNELKLELIEHLRSNNTKSHDMFDAFIQSFSAQRTNLEESLMNLSQQLTQNTREVAKEFASLETFVAKVLQEKAKEDQATAAEILSTQEMVKESSNFSITQISLLKENFNNFISNMESHYLNSAPLICEQMVSQSNKLQESNQRLHGDAKKIATEFRQSFKNVETSCKAGSSVVNKLDRTVTTLCQSNIDMASNAKLQVDEQSDILSKHLEEFYAKETDEVNDILLKERTVLAELKSELEADALNLNKFDNQVKEQAEPLRSILSKVVQSEIPSSLESIGNEIYSATLHQESSRNYICKEVNSLNDQIRSLQLKNYEATGETPQKINFTFPINLTTTSPHERILQRFRAGDSSISNDLALAMVTKLPESSGSSSDSIDSCGTTSSSASNLENKIPNNERTSKIAKIKKTGKSAKNGTEVISKKKVIIQPTK